MKIKVLSIEEITLGLSYLRLNISIDSRQAENMLVELREYYGDAWVVEHLKKDLSAEDFKKLLENSNP